VNERLIPNLSTREAFRFGWNKLGVVLIEGWWLYLAVFIAGVGLAAWGASDTRLQTEPIEWIAGIAALGAATRYAFPSFRLSIRTVLGAIAVDLLCIGAMLVLLPTPFVVALLAHAPAVLLVYVVLLPVGIWASVKFACAQAFYTLRSGEGTTSVFGAIRESWFFLSDENWLRGIGLPLLICLVAALPPAIAGFTVFWLFAKASPMAVTVVAAALYYAGSITSAVWMQISLIALASTELSATNLGRESPTP